MGENIKIFIVEDEMIIGANISLQLSKLGYEVTGLVARGEEALNHIIENQPDIVLMDIQLKGNLDGIETAKLIHNSFNIPVIFLTANADDAHFNRAKETKPAAFLSKPFRNIDLQRAIELAVDTRLVNTAPEEKIDIGAHPPGFILNNCIFVKTQDKMVKINIENIYYIEAERNYCRIFCKDKSHLLVTTLKEVIEKLPPDHFIRIHRSFIVNISHIEEMTNSYLVVSRKTIPINKTAKENLLKRLHTL